MINESWGIVEKVHLDGTCTMRFNMDNPEVLQFIGIWMESGKDAANAWLRDQQAASSASVPATPPNPPTPRPSH